jgi:glycosyltransferase involved in cell wall biosynthesis
VKSISVIIPVYNAAKFIEKAVESVLIQPEVSEILIVDDGSTDNSLAICTGKANKEERIKVLQHPDKKNHGRSATRNLGIKMAQGDYIAFLDADDYYLPGRFKQDIALLAETDTDGVYNAVSAHYYETYKGQKPEWLELTTVTGIIPPEHLFEEMSPIGDKGWFHADGLTVKKTIFQKAGLFDEQLSVAEDTHMWSKMALTGRLLPGVISKPVAMRGIHSANVIFDKKLYRSEKKKMYNSLLNFARKTEADKHHIELIRKRRRHFLFQSYKYKLAKTLSGLTTKNETE